jgi:hypothetical protein
MRPRRLWHIFHQEPCVLIQLQAAGLLQGWCSSWRRLGQHRLRPRRLWHIFYQGARVLVQLQAAGLLQDWCSR